VALLFKNILVSVDFSDGSNIAFKKAIELCEPRKARNSSIKVLDVEPYFHFK
jgi:hypothetical protein